MIENNYTKKIYQRIRKEKWYDVLRTAVMNKKNKKVIDSYIENVTLFSHVEIETINRCNGTCDFCPVNKYVDPRKTQKMEEELFYKIIDELNEIGYSDEVCLFSNNEPFIDNRIIKFAKYTRNKLKNAYIYIFSNGELVTNESLKEILPYLDLLVIDNYNDELQLNSSSKRINDFCNNNPEYGKKIKIVIRKMHETLTSRGGQAPNLEGNYRKINCNCRLPYEQLIIRPSGKVSLCCNDALGKMTLGDVNLNSLKEIWFSETYKDIRNRVKINRSKSNIQLCEFCDFL